MRGERHSASSLVLVSHRLPVSIRIEHDTVISKPSAGGLATALSSVTDEPGALWVGYAGDLSSLDDAQKEHVARKLASMKLSHVEIPTDEHTGYYEGFSNGVLWPLLHYLVDKVQLDAARSYAAYRAVNERFARHVAARAPRGARVWVHDYQLFLLPSLLRALRPDVRIGFFLHVPFPTHEVFRILPWREELLRGVLGADLIGFHTESYQHHFAATAAHVLGVDLSHDELSWDGRTVRLATFAISIDVERWACGAASERAALRATELRDNAGARRIVLGVDRLDYTKGIPRRLLAIERFLERFPALRDTVQFVQVAVPSRESVEEYAAYRRVVDALVGRINGTFGTADRVPIHLLHKGVDFDELCALYRAADVMLVTPLRDGMNLVAKEYCIAQHGAPGVLVLSEFAGAAEELCDAILVNPYDVDSVAEAIACALEMPAHEREQRMQRLEATIRANPVSAWAARFVNALDAQKKARDEPRNAPQLAPPSITPSQTVQWLLDYDGTLVPLADRPERAVADDALTSLLARLCAVPFFHVHIVSGRASEWLDNQLGALPIALHAEHGAFSRSADARHWTENIAIAPDWKRDARAVIEEVTGPRALAFIEEKRSSLAWHYRRLLPELVAEHLGALRARLESLAQRFDLTVLEGAKVLELRPRDASKARIVERVARRSPTSSLVLIGDDRTDEEMFRAAPEGAISVKVGPGPSLARYRLLDVGQVRAYLARSVEGAR